MDLDSTKFQNEIINLIKGVPEGIEGDILKQRFSGNNQQMNNALNKLSTSGKIKVSETKDKALIFSLQEGNTLKNYKELVQNEIPIYQLIEEASSKGISVSDLKLRLGLTTEQINQILNSLEKKNLITNFKSIQSKRKKIWILSSIEADSSLSGGIWYSGKDNSFNEELIISLSNQILEILEKKGKCSNEEIAKRIRTNANYKQELKDEEIEQLLETLFLDDQIELIDDQSQRILSTQNGKICKLKYYQKVNKINLDTAYLYTPCAFCPIENSCCFKEYNNPNECPHIREWIKNL